MWSTVVEVLSRMGSSVLLFSHPSFYVERILQDTKYEVGMGLVLGEKSKMVIKHLKRVLYFKIEPINENWFLRPVFTFKMIQDIPVMLLNGVISEQVW